MSDEKDDENTDGLTPLNIRQTLFVARYCANGFNGFRAAVDAGYSEDSAKQIASENLTKPNIKEAVNKEIEKMLKDTAEDKLRWLNEVRNIAHSNIRDIAEFDEDGVRFKASKDLDDNAAALIETVESTTTFDKNGNKTVNNKIKMHSKMRGLDTLGRFLKMLEGEQQVGVTIVIANDEKDLA